MAKASTVTVDVTGTEAFETMVKMISTARLILGEIWERLDNDDHAKEIGEWLDEFDKEYVEA